MTASTAPCAAFYRWPYTFAPDYEIEWALVEQRGKPPRKEPLVRFEECTACGSIHHVFYSWRSNDD